MKVPDCGDKNYEISFVAHTANYKHFYHCFRIIFGLHQELWKYIDLPVEEYLFWIIRDTDEGWFDVEVELNEEVKLFRFTIMVPKKGNTFLHNGSSIARKHLIDAILAGIPTV